jgi:uncharacterized membrane protein YdbT with pleckstrin-like domain
MTYYNHMKQLNPKATWLFFLTALGRGLPILFVLFFFWLSFSANERISHNIVADQLVWIIPLLILLVIIISWVWAQLSYRFYKYELREDGFRKESGIIWKKYTTIPYGRIQNVEIYRGLVARILGLSDLHIQTAGGVAQPRYGAFSEGRLPGLSREDAERMRDELIERVRQNSKSQGL